MTLTIGSSTYTLFTAQPFGYEEDDVRAGLSARRWRISALLTAEEWADAVAAYDTWRDLRIQDPDSVADNDIGTTVSLSMTDINGITYEDIDCWYATAPSADQSGLYLNATWEMVDAAQALEVLLRKAEKDRERTEDTQGTYGTITLGSATIALTTPADGRANGPALSRSAAGKSVVTGPYVADSIKRIQGYLISGTPSDLLSWYASVIGTTATGTWYPDGDLPPPRGEVVISGGVKSTRYYVDLTLRELV